MALSVQEYKNLLNEVIRNQITILGPDITLAKIKKIPEISLDSTNQIAGLSGSPEDITNKLIDQFRALSEDIVKKTMKPLLLRAEEPVKDATPETPLNVANANQQQETKQAEIKEMKNES